MCTSPNYMTWTGRYTHNGKPKLNFIGHHQYKRLIDNKDIPFIEVPCQKCLECRIQYARDWADRCVLEAKQYDHNYFVTLTYDDVHLPYKASLNKEHPKRFLNLLRKYMKRKLGFNGKIRVFYSAEYGDLSMRPHYHFILFNCPINDLSTTYLQEVDGKIVKHNRPSTARDNLFFSNIIYDCWKDKNGEHLGQITVGRFNYDTAAYVSQYVTKKIDPAKDKKTFYYDLGLEPEYLRMSTHPGIGSQFYEDHPLLHYDGKLVIDGDGEAHLSAVPRYYDKLFIKKYGEDVFIPIQVNRSKKKLINIDGYGKTNHNKDLENRIRADSIKRKHHLKKSL